MSTQLYPVEPQEGESVNMLLYRAAKALYDSMSSPAVQEPTLNMPPQYFVYVIAKLLYGGGGGGGAAIPDQAGHAGEVLGTNGTDLAWVAQGGAATLQIEAETLAELKAIATTTKSAGAVVLTKFSGESAAIMVLDDTNANDDAAGDHRPDDFNAVTNIKSWHRSS